MPIAPFTYFSCVYVFCAMIYDQLLNLSHCAQLPGNRPQMTMHRKDESATPCSGVYESLERFIERGSGGWPIVAADCNSPPLPLVNLCFFFPLLSLASLFIILPPFFHPLFCATTFSLPCLIYLYFLLVSIFLFHFPTILNPPISLFLSLPLLSYSCLFPCIFLPFLPTHFFLSYLNASFSLMKMSCPPSPHRLHSFILLFLSPLEYMNSPFPSVSTGITLFPFLLASVLQYCPNNST